MKYTKFIIFILVLGLLWGLKGQLHLFGAEVGSANTEISKNLYMIESSFSPRLITRVDTGNQKLVALTFDDGPDPRFTPQVLDILKEHHAKATFFVVGKSAEANANLIKREIAEGHEVENHTYTHPNLRIDTAIKTEEEIKRCGQTLLFITGQQPHYFRPPKDYSRSKLLTLPRILDTRPSYGTSVLNTSGLRAQRIWQNVSLTLPNQASSF